MSVKYDFKDFNPEKLSPHNIDRLAIESVPDNSLVLDVGCATGFMGEYLKKKKGCKVFGIDLRDDEIKIAKKRLDGVIIGDIEKQESIDKLLKATKGKKFDVILATSLIEHLANPYIAIKNMVNMLGGGRINGCYHS